ncbi:hypothetical protein DFH06DRAFT_1130956 [Mycena polygramma]|nr:hypothetical protein DFH06DRAFT_1130956 [Mycena polygramma]
MNYSSAEGMRAIPRIDIPSQYTPSTEPISPTSIGISSEWVAWSPPSHHAGKRKTRRRKSRPELAPDQPLTTRGKVRTRVSVACLPCRSRKIRCDGSRPVCHNCDERASGSSQCSYDALPKRRGPDKTPGARRFGRAARTPPGITSSPRCRTASSADTPDYPANHDNHDDKNDDDNNNGTELQDSSFWSGSSSDNQRFLEFLKDYSASQYEGRSDATWAAAEIASGLIDTRLKYDLLQGKAMIWHKYWVKSISIQLHLKSRNLTTSLGENGEWGQLLLACNLMLAALGACNFKFATSGVTFVAGKFENRCNFERPAAAEATV